MSKIERGKLNKLLTIERPVPDDSFTGSGSGTWEYVGKAWAEVEDRLPSRAERTEGGINLATRAARVRLDIRDDITSDMRFVLDSRVMEIVAGPAVVNEPEALEFMVADYSTAGGAA